MSTQWTESQRDAIFARGGTLLVSAAAGSGKTAVLVQRVMTRITDPECPVDADRLLVVTFTKAAAAEMSARISAEISRILEADPFNVRLQRQQILLARAHICTIDSFCHDLVRENFYKLGVAPDFRILDDSEIAVLRTQAAEAALDEFYGQGDPKFYEFVEAFSAGRDDSRIAQIVNELYDFVRAHPFPKRWFSEKAALYRSGLPAGKTLWGKAVFDYADQAVDACLSMTEDALERMEEDAALTEAYCDAYRSDLAGLLALKQAISQNDWDKTSFQANGFSFQKLKPLRGYSDDPLKDRVTAARKEVKDTVAKIGTLFPNTEQQAGDEIQCLAPLVKTLFQVTERFSEILEELKNSRRAADFSDLEHWALRLLVKGTDSGFERTKDAMELAAQFDEIMVDECQDTNEAQDLIFRAISREENNLFLVGDVKQSIYRFRQAMPRLFLHRRETFPAYSREKNEFPACVVLDRNFRSRKGVTDVVNFVFRQLMSRETGEMDYTTQEELVPGADYPPDPQPEAVLDIVDLSALGEDADAVRAESRHIADLIYSMTANGCTVTDHGKQRPAVYRDFCILLRSANRYAHEYAREITALGIPAWAETVGGFFEAAEIGVAVSLLRVIDNPMQDIPLLAVLMSPIYGFGPDEISEVRLCRTGRLYPAVTTAAKSGNERAARFLSDMEAFRTLAATMPSDRLIRTVFEKTGYPQMVQAMPNGDLRLANLRLLLEYASKYEAAGYNGLSGFIRFIDRLQKSGSDLSSASAISESANVVRIMSIHHSKGLEFPVCIVAGCSRNFNRERSDVLLHPELGPGVKLRDPASGARFSTLPREAAALELERDEMSEELRVLYVAMTRAKERLILVTSLKNPERTLSKLALRLTPGRKRLEPFAVRNVSCISDWLLLCALRHPCGSTLREKVQAPPGVAVPAEGAWTIRMIQLPQEEKRAREELPPARPDRTVMEKIREKMNFVYPNDGLSGVCAKVAASELAAEEFSAAFAATSRPAFLSESGLTPAERGTALHAYLQFADYRRAAEAPEEELKRLVRELFLTKVQADAVELERIRAFFRSPVAQRMLQSSNMEREYRFAVEIPASSVNPELTGSAGKEKVVLQGAADCVFEEGGGLVLVDYKTDRTYDPEALWNRYRKQLALYRYALEKSTGRKVRECLLYSFAMNREISGTPESLLNLPLS